MAGGEGEEKKDVEKEGGAGGGVGWRWALCGRLCSAWLLEWAIVKDFRL